MRNDEDSNHPSYDAVRTDILPVVPTFRSCLLLPPSGWYTLTKLVAATSETLLPMHQNTLSPHPRQLDYSSLRSKLFSSAFTYNKNSLLVGKMPPHDNFPASLYTPLY